MRESALADEKFFGDVFGVEGRRDVLLDIIQDLIDGLVLGAHSSSVRSSKGRYSLWGATAW